VVAIEDQPERIPRGNHLSTFRRHKRTKQSKKERAVL